MKVRIFGGDVNKKEENIDTVFEKKRVQKVLYFIKLRANEQSVHEELVLASLGKIRCILGSVIFLTNLQIGSNVVYKIRLSNGLEKESHFHSHLSDFYYLSTDHWNAALRGTALRNGAPERRSGAALREAGARSERNSGNCPGAQVGAQLRKRPEC